MRTVISFLSLAGMVALVVPSSGCVRRNDPTLFQRVEQFVENDQVALYNKTHAEAAAASESDGK